MERLRRAAEYTKDRIKTSPAELLLLGWQSARVIETAAEHGAGSPNAVAEIGKTAIFLISVETIRTSVERIRRGLSSL